MFGRRKVAVLVSEFLGTAVLTLLILSVARSSLGLPFFVAAAAGAAYALMTYSVASISGAQFNPALTVAAWTARRISTVNAIVFIAVQLLGGWAAYGIYTYLTKQSIPAAHINFEWRLLVAEMVGAGILAFGVAAAAYQRLVTGASAAVAGFGYAAGIMAVSFTSFHFLNPAVVLGLNSWAWTTTVLGPIVGAVLGYNIYGFLFAPEVAATAGAAVAASPVTTSTVVKPARASKKVAPARKTTARASVAKKPAAKRKTTAKRK